MLNRRHLLMGAAGAGLRAGCGTRAGTPGVTGGAFGRGELQRCLAEGALIAAGMSLDQFLEDVAAHGRVGEYAEVVTLTSWWARKYALRTAMLKP